MTPLVSLAIATFGCPAFSHANAATQTKSFPIAGVVLTQSGQPVANATIADRWVCENGHLVPDSTPLTTDGNGRFSGSVSAFRFPVALMAVSKSGDTGASVLLGNSPEDAQHLNFTLKPLQRVSMKVTVKELPGFQETEGMEIYLTDPAARSSADRTTPMCFLMTFGNQRGPLRLPPGSYRLLVRTRTISYFEHRFDVTASEAVNLGTLKAEASTEGLLFGHKLPEWHIAAARGLPSTPRLSDFRGKYLLVEAWAYWCVPCVQDGIPELMRFWDEHKDQQTQFALVALHTYNSTEGGHVASIADVDRLTKATKARFWGGRDIPVPLLLDDSDETAKAWGIGAIPNVMLIDPEGVLVRTNDPYRYLAAKLADSATSAKR